MPAMCWLTASNQVLQTLFDVVLSEPQRTFLARLYGHSRHEAEAWAGRSYVDAEDIYIESGLASDDMLNIAQRLIFLGDPERKALIRPESRAVGTPRTGRPMRLPPS